MKYSDDSDPAWDLLSRAQKTEVAPNFTQNVMREVRKLEFDQPEKGGLGAGWLAMRWASALVAAAAMVIGVIFLINSGGEEAQSGGGAEIVQQPAETIYKEEISIEEFANELEELAFLSELMEVPDTSLLADEDLATLLF